MTGAQSPEAITHALTLKGAQIAWCILQGPKVIENRRWRIAPGWYALHVGAGRTSPEAAAFLQAVVPALPEEHTLPHSALVGALHISHSLKSEDCGDCAWAAGPVCNVIDAVAVAPEPVMGVRGALGLWRMDVALAEALRQQLSHAQVRTTDVSALPALECIGHREPPAKRRRRSRVSSRSADTVREYESPFVTCPICERDVLRHTINEHLDGGCGSGTNVQMAPVDNI